MRSGESGERRQVAMQTARPPHSSAPTTGAAEGMHPRPLLRSRLGRRPRRRPAPVDVRPLFWLHGDVAVMVQPRVRPGAGEARWGWGGRGHGGQRGDARVPSPAPTPSPRHQRPAPRPQHRGVAPATADESGLGAWAARQRAFRARRSTPAGRPAALTLRTRSLDQKTPLFAPPPPPASAAAPAAGQRGQTGCRQPCCTRRRAAAWA